MADSIAVGVPYIYRTDALKRLLRSANDVDIDTFYIADNSKGKIDSELDITDYDFDVEVLDLAYHVGQGACRSAIASAFEEDYLVVVDSDMELPRNLHVLKKILQGNRELGGVSGVLIEGNRIRSGCRNIFELPLFLGREALEIGIRGEPELHDESGSVIGFFDYLTNAAMFRRECFEDYSWDESMYNMAHEDFYVGHFHQSEWKFACCPEVFFRHYRGEAGTYPSEFREKKEMETAEARFLRKWGYSEFVWGKQREWLSNDLNNFKLKYLVKEIIPPQYYLLPRQIKQVFINQHLETK